MSIVRCEQGLHFYDNRKYDDCPYCMQHRERLAGNDMQMQKTVAMYQSESKEMKEFVYDFQQKLRVDDIDSNRTIGIYSPARGNDYVTGWLICIRGAEKGRDYRLHHGFNKIGRSYDMDVYIADDESVSRDVHCQIVYDSKSNKFYIIPGKGTYTYVNNDYLENQKALISGDIIQMGNMYFEFIAYCREGHKWEEE